MDSNRTTLQRRALAGPKALSEFATTQDEKNQPSTVATPLKDKKFGIVQVYVKPKEEIKTGDSHTFENLKLEGVISVQTMIESNTDILCVKYTEEYDSIAIGFTDGSVRLYRADNMEAITTLIDEEIEKNVAPVTAIKHRPVSKQYPIENMFTCTYASGIVKCWNYNFTQCIYTIREQRQTYGITYHHKLAKFVTYGDNNKIYLYDEETRTQERVFGASEIPGQIVNGHTSKVFAARFNRRSNHELITGGWDDVVHFWDVRQPTSLRHISGVHMCAEGLDISSRGTDILACSWQKDNPLQIFDYNTGNLKESFDPDTTMNKFYCGNYLSDDFIVCGGTEPHVFRLIDLRRKATTASIVNLPGGIYCLDVGPLKSGKKKTKVELTNLPKITFCSGKKVFQIEFA